MKRIITIAAACLLLAACSQGKYGRGVPESYVPLLDEAMERAGDNAGELMAAIKKSPAGQREAMAFLITNMNQGDLDTLTAELLRSNVDYAYRAKEKYEWARTLPDAVFFNEVLPYASVDERREDWRPLFYEMFGSKVEGLTDIREAVFAVNTDINEAVEVEYNTLREKTNQSPSESMRQHMASCTGLTILLVDAFRSVGIPARFAGTPAWHDDRGNHSWAEVMIDGEWYFTEFYYSGELNYSWFLRDAGKADHNDRSHAVYASSFAHTGDWFPMIWSEASREVPGVNVTDRYVELYNSTTNLQAATGSHVPVRFMMFRNEGGRKQSADRVAANVDVFRDGEQMAGGRTSGPTQDMNDVLEYSLEKNSTYVFRYENLRGEQTEVTAHVGTEPLTVIGYME